MKIVAVTAHPDDLEISCSGTLLKLQAQGHDVISVISVCPSAEDRNGRNKTVTSLELKSSMMLSGIAYRVFDTDVHDNGRPNLRLDNVTMSRFWSLLEDCDLAILPHPNDYHQDHSNTYHLALPFMHKHAKTIWCAHGWPYCYLHQPPNVIRNITHQWPMKERMIRCYDSYFSDTDIEKIKRLNQVWGDQGGVDMAEGFTIIKDHG